MDSSVRFADNLYPVINRTVQSTADTDRYRAHDLRKSAITYKKFKPNRFSYQMSVVSPAKSGSEQLAAPLLHRLAPWQSLIETIGFRHGIIVASCIELHRWFFAINALLFIPILVFVVVPQAITPANPVSPLGHRMDGLVLNRSANNFSCYSFRTCFAFSWFFLTPYQPMLSVGLDGFPYYNMQLAYLLCLAALFMIGLCAASGIIFGSQPIGNRVLSLPLFAWVYNGWNHEISNARLSVLTSSLVAHRLKENLRLTFRSESPVDTPVANRLWITRYFSRKVLAVVLFELLFGLLFAATLVAVYYFYDLAEYAGVDGVIVETIGPLLATALPTFFLLSADLTAAGVLSGNKERRLALYQPWHLFFRAVLFRIAAIIVVAYRWTFCFPVLKRGLNSMPLTYERTTTSTLKPGVNDTGVPVAAAVYAFSFHSQLPPPFCPRDDTGWEVLVGRQSVLLLLYTAGFFLMESCCIFIVAKWRKGRQTKLLSGRKHHLVAFPASRFAAYAVTLDLLSLVGAYFFPLSPGLAAVLLLTTFYSVTSLVSPRFSDSPVVFSWNNRTPGARGSTDDEHVFQATVAIRFLRLFPYIFSGLFYMYIFYSVPVTPNCGPLRPSLDANHTHAQPGISAIRQAIIMPLINVPVIGWTVRLLDQPPFAYLIALAVAVTATFAIARIVAVRQRLDFVTKQLVLAREDSRFLFEELQKAKRRTGIR